MELKSKRLKIIPLKPEEMAVLCEGQDKLNALLGLTNKSVLTDEHLKEAYKEMYQLCCDHPDDYLWYTNWQIILKDENTAIGSIGFRGPINENHEVEIGYGIDEEYRLRGFATEAVKTICDFAYRQGAYYIQAEAEEDNEASKKVLKKCGFKPIGRGEEGIRYEYTEPNSVWFPIYMCFGISIGCSIGYLTNRLALCLSIGIAIGCGVGLWLDEFNRKKRKRN